MRAVEENLIPACRAAVTVEQQAQADVDPIMMNSLEQRGLPLTRVAFRLLRRRFAVEIAPLIFDGGSLLRVGCCNRASDLHVCIVYTSSFSLKLYCLETKGTQILYWVHIEGI